MHVCSEHFGKLPTTYEERLAVWKACPNCQAAQKEANEREARKLAHRILKELDK